MNQTTGIQIETPNVSRPSPRRDSYGALRHEDIPARVIELRDQVLEEIGVWPGVTSTNKRGGFDATNVEVYGFDEGRQLIALQIRHTWKRRDNDWLRQEKWYALVGIDDGQMFSHVIPTSFRRIRDIDDMSPEDVVRWAESKIFRVPLARLDTIIRQGDVALVPVRSIPRSAIDYREKWCLLRDSHVVEVDGKLYYDWDDKIGDRFWAHGLVQIGHERDQHKPIDAEGRYEIVVGDRLDIDLSTID